MAQYGVTVSRDDSEPSVLGSARSEASVYLGASGDLRAETHTLSSSGTPAIRLEQLETRPAQTLRYPFIQIISLRIYCDVIDKERSYNIQEYL
jgi:hypothetical protein